MRQIVSSLMLSVSLVVAMYSSAARAEIEIQELFELSLDELMDIKVSTGSKFDQKLQNSPSLVSVISHQDIQLFGANNLYEVLERVVSFYMTESFFYPQNVVAVRGDLQSHADNHVLILINGRPFRESYSGGVNFPFYNAFPLTAIERIEVIRGPGSVLYGTNAMSGVINVITRKQQKSSTQLSVTSGSFASRQLQGYGSYHLDNVDINAAVNLFKEDGWQFALFDQNARFESIDRGERNAALFVDISTGNWRWQNLYVSSEQNFMGASASWSGEPDFNSRLIDGVRTHSSLGYTYDVNDNQSIEVNLSFGRMAFEQYNYRAFSNDTSVELTHQYKISDQLNWVAGLTLWHQDVGSAGRRSVAPVTSFTSLWKEAYGQFTYSPFTNLLLTAGLQLNKPENAHRSLTPRVAASYDINEHWTLRGAYAEAYRAAFGVETNFDLILRNEDGTIRGGLRGNAALKPERVASKEFAINYHTETRQLELAYFRSRQSDLIGRVRAEDRVLDFVNTASLHNSGIELTGKWHFSNSWSFNISYSHQQNNSGDGVDDFTLAPNDMVKAGFIYKGIDQHLTLGVFDNYIGASPDVSIRNPNRQALNANADAYHLVTANMRYQIDDWFNSSVSSSKNYLSLYIYNLFNESIYQPEFVGRNINTIPARAGRSAYLSLTLAF